MGFDKFDDGKACNYNYLIDMSIRWMTKEKYEELCKLKNEKKQFIQEFKQKPIDELWIEDLELLKSKLPTEI